MQNRKPIKLRILTPEGMKKRRQAWREVEEAQRKTRTEVGGAAEGLKGNIEGAGKDLEEGLANKETKERD